MVTGFPLNRIGELRTHFPSLRAISNHSNGNVASMLSMQFPDKRGCTTEGIFRIIIKCDDICNTIPRSWILNYTDRGEHPHLWKKETIPGTTRQAYWVCDGTWSGAILPIYNALNPDPVVRLLGYIEHLISVLNTK